MLHERLEKGGILVNPAFRKKEELFRWVADDAAKKGLIASADTLYESLFMRENEISTEFPGGVAIPHARTDAITQEFLYVIISRNGIKFSALGSRVKATFLLGAPKSSAHNLDIMALMARLLRNETFVKQLVEKESPDAVRKLIVANDSLTPVNPAPSHHYTHALFLTLTREKHMEIAMELAIELGIRGVYVADSTNAAGKIALNLPFVSLMVERKKRLLSKTLFGIIENEQIAARLCAHLRKEGIDLTTPGSGILYTTPLGTVYGGVNEEYF